MIESIIDDFTESTFNVLCKKKTKNKISRIVKIISEMILEKFLPVFYTIISILVLMFIMNCFQFFYYIKYTPFHDFRTFQELPVPV